MQKQSCAKQEPPINLTSLKVSMSKESKGGVRDKPDDFGETRKLGKLGMKEQPLVGQIGALPKSPGTERWHQLPIFLPLTEETLCIAQKN